MTRIVFLIWDRVPETPKDDHVLEVAVASKVQTIVTHNLKDFAGIGKFGIQAIPPRNLLEVSK